MTPETPADGQGSRGASLLVLGAGSRTSVTRPTGLGATRRTASRVRGVVACRRIAPRSGVRGLTTRGARARRASRWYCCTMWRNQDVRSVFGSFAALCVVCVLASCNSGSSAGSSADVRGSSANAVGGSDGEVATRADRVRSCFEQQGVHVTKPSVNVAATSGGAVQANYPHGQVIVLLVDDATEMKAAWKKEAALVEKQSASAGHMYLLSPRNNAIVVASTTKTGVSTTKNDGESIGSCLSL